MLDEADFTPREDPLLLFQSCGGDARVVVVGCVAREHCWLLAFPIMSKPNNV